MSRLATNFLLFAWFLSTCVAIGFGQAVQRDSTAQYKGKVRLITTSREFLMMNGRAIPSLTMYNDQREYNEYGRLVRWSVFGKGNVEQRNLYTESDGKVNIEVLYFDSSTGKPIPPQKTPFVSNIERSITGDLCSNFSEKAEVDAKAGIRRVTEICDSGSIRSKIVIEFNSDNTYVRRVLEDAMGRTYEAIFIYDSRSFITETRYIADEIKTPKYSWNQTYVNHKVDEIGNLIEVLGTGIHSSRPNEVSIQFIDRNEFVYFK